VTVDDPGCACYATILVANTGDYFEVGKGAYPYIKRRYLDATAKLQRQRAALVTCHHLVLLAKKNLEQVKLTSKSDRSATDVVAVADAECALRESVSRATTALKQENYGRYNKIGCEINRLEKGHEKYVANLRNITCAIMASTGRRGVALFPTNLCDQKRNSRHGSALNVGMVTAMKFGQLRKQLKSECAATRCWYMECREERSSSWCVYCGAYNGNLGASRTFKCGNAKCLMSYPRDAGSGLSILKMHEATRAKRYLPRMLGGIIEAKADGVSYSSLFTATTRADPHGYEHAHVQYI
jgi:hypothetical protein